MKKIKFINFKFFFIFLSVLLITFFKYKKIKIAIHYYNLSNGGAQRLTSLLTYYLSKMTTFEVFLFLNAKVKNEYKIPFNVKKRYLPRGINHLKKELIKNRIDIIIYQSYNIDEIRFLNNLKRFKTIIIIHCSFFTWFYLRKFSFIKSLYNEYRNSK